MALTCIAVTGGNGFIGRHLLEAMVANGQRVRALTRRPPEHCFRAQDIEWVNGDLADSAAWLRLLEPGCTVVNLAFSRVATMHETVSATRAMVASCVKMRIRRLIHCSTISVYGRAAERVLTEASSCHPFDEYGKIKLMIESELISASDGRFELVVLRPSVVFGVGGANLVKLINDLIAGPRFLNYLRSSLYARRRTHLVPVETVVAAVMFLCKSDLNSPSETFIVSDDNNPMNNFHEVERIMMEQLGSPYYAVSPVPLPSQLLEALLLVRGRANIDTLAEYCADKLEHRGFVKPVTLEVALRRFVSTYLRSKCVSK